MASDRFIVFADRASILYAATSFLTLITAALMTSGIAFGDRGVIGGDFLAFYTAGTFVLNGDLASAYDAAAFDAALKEQAPLDVIAMLWLYPPVMALPAAAFALMPYKLAFAFWTMGGLAVFSLCLRQLGFRGAQLRILTFSTLTISILAHGQIAAVTAGLIFLAVYQPDKRWIIAGLAAGVLTIKPQLGLLIPFAFLAVGAWRAIALAGVSAIAMHGASILLFGMESMEAFVAGLSFFNADIIGPALYAPERGMTSLFAQLKLFGVSGEQAMIAQYAFTAALAGAVFLVYRRVDITPLAKAAFVCAAALLAAPYAYGYEMMTLTLAGAYLAQRAESPSAPLGASLIAFWVIIAIRPFFGEPTPVNHAFVLCVGAFALLSFTLFRPQAIDRRALPA